MKRFITMVFGVAIFFVGVGALVDKAGAKFKSDDRALELIQKARVAIGGDAAIRSIQSLRIVGETTRSFKGDGQARAEIGKTEIAMQFPDKLMKSTSIGDGQAKGEAIRTMDHSRTITLTGKEGEMKVTVDGDGMGEGRGAGADTHIIMRKADGTTQELTGVEAQKWIEAHHEKGDGNVRIVVKRADGTTETINGGEARIGEPASGGIFVRKMKDGEVESTGGEPHTFKVDGNNVFVTRNDGAARGVAVAAPRNNDMLRLTLSLLLTAPAGMDVEYSYRGEGDLDGTACNIVNASFGGQSYKLYLDRSSNLPVGMKFNSMAMPQVFTFTGKAGETGDAPGGALTRVNTTGEGDKVVTFTAKVPEGAEGEKGNVMLMRMDGGGHGAPVELTVKFSDYRSVNGVQLPYTWTQTGGEADETFVVSNYEVNPANIADRFQGQKVMLRTAKPVDK